MSADHRPTASLLTLRRRAALLRAVREEFHREGYWEVETPLLSRDVCVDAWLDPIIVRDDSLGGERFLQTSPEFAMKRLVAAGADAIFEITRAFRRGEQGGRHNPEFTMVEWYRVGATYSEQMSFTERLVRALAAFPAEASMGDPWPPAPPLSDEPFPRIRYDDAFEAVLGTRILTLQSRQLRELAASRNVVAPESLTADDLDGWRNLLLAECVEPWLAAQPAVFLYDYPASQAALATVAPIEPPVARRFELYLGGVEICNGYQELTDAEELSRRMRKQAALRRAAGLSELPVEGRLLAAMRDGLPECSGVALGFDRLVQWRLGLPSIADVIAFPMDRA
ncbi:MAG: EF-P lysine aminoacylase GenX [Planctomyces sp.]|nr:EF-P lysine aminoacylase GenX [Planctomyces sp.]